MTCCLSISSVETIKRYSDSKWPENPNVPYPTAVVRERFTGVSFLPIELDVRLISILSNFTVVHI